MAERGEQALERGERGGVGSLVARELLGCAQIARLVVATRGVDGRAGCCLDHFIYLGAERVEVEADKSRVDARGDEQARGHRGPEEQRGQRQNGAAGLAEHCRGREDAAAQEDDEQKNDHERVGRHERARDPHALEPRGVVTAVVAIERSELQLQIALVVVEEKELEHAEAGEEGERGEEHKQGEEHEELDEKAEQHDPDEGEQSGQEQTHENETIGVDQVAQHALANVLQAHDAREVGGRGEQRSACQVLTALAHQRRVRIVGQTIGASERFVV